MLTRRHLLLSAPALILPATLRAAEGDPLLIRDLYNRDRSFSDLALRLEGKEARFTGFMAPPLKAEAHFFVLTKMPMAVCPFCETEAEWPDDILPVFTKRVVRVMPFNVRVTARGRFSMERHVDEETGFLSLLRLTDARVER